MSDMQVIGFDLINEIRLELYVKLSFCPNYSA